MSLLRSFSFGQFNGYDEIPAYVLEHLFHDLSDNPTKKVDCCYEVVSAALAGRINFNTEFNLSAYDKEVKEHHKLDASHRAKKVDFLDDFGGDDENEHGGVDLSRLEVRGVVDDFARSDERSYLIQEACYIKSHLDFFLIEEQICFLTVYRQALKGIPESIAIIKRLCENYDWFNDFIDTLLQTDDETRALVYNILNI